MGYGCRKMVGGYSGSVLSFGSTLVRPTLFLGVLLSILAPGAAAQIVDFDVSHRVIRQGETLSFSNLTVAGVDPITGWAWDFGDAGMSTAATPTHLYSVPGHYTVALTASTVSGDVTETKTDYIIVLGPGAPVIINEFVASNHNGLLDEDGEYSDWIELYNASDTAVSLLGWALSDDDLDPAKWLLPNITIGPGGFLVVFASDKDRSVYPGELHTNFKLNADGEYIALIQDPGIPTVAHSYEAREQRADVSFGLVGMDTGLPEPELYEFMETPTPGAVNSYASAQADEASTPVLSHLHGHYVTGFNLAITSTETGAQIYYTNDGTLPTEADGILYGGPFLVSDNTVIRALVVAPDHIPSKVVTATYIIGASDVEKSLPSLCVVGDPTKDFWAPDGIMAVIGGYYDGSGRWQPLTGTDFNAFLEHGREWERHISLEYFDPNGAPSSPELIGFQQDCGIRVNGSKWRREQYRVSPTMEEPWIDYEYKKSFRYYFRDSYGDGRLDYPLIPNANLSGLKEIVMRAGTDDPYNPFIKDEMSRRLMDQMGNLTSLGGFVHFYLNGHFKGYYNVVERYGEDFFQQALGSDIGWDVVKGTDEAALDRRELVDGDWDAWFALNDYARDNDLSNPANYATIGTMVDINNFIDYLIMECYGANFDWPRNNWYMARERSTNTALGRWRFYVWDMEMSYFALSDSAEDFTVESYSDNPFHLQDGWTFLRAPSTGRDGSPIALLYQALRANDDFKLTWEARASQLLGPGGVLGTANVQSQYNALYDEVNEVLLFQPMNTFIRDVWAPERPAWLLYWFAQEGLMPTLDGTDSDGDGLMGMDEVLLGTNPLSADTDGDGISDGDEVNLTSTDPLDPDSDGDLMPDGWEIANGLDPNSNVGDDGASGDPDLDTYSNLEEYNGGTDPQSSGSFPVSLSATGMGVRALMVAALMALGLWTMNRRSTRLRAGSET